MDTHIWVGKRKEVTKPNGQRTYEANCRGEENTPERRRMMKAIIEGITATRLSP